MGLEKTILKPGGQLAGGPDSQAKNFGLNSLSPAFHSYHVPGNTHWQARGYEKPQKKLEAYF